MSIPNSSRRIEAFVVRFAFVASCAIAAPLTAFTLGACDFINTPTKTANGELYQSGDARYDGYFVSVHEQQLAAANWPDDSRNARRPILTALSLKTGASNPTILAATRDKKGDAALAHVIDDTINGERDFVRKLNAAQVQLDELLKRGEELKKETVDDRRNMAADKADEKKKAKKDEVKHEMSAAVDAVDTMITDAKKGAREAEQLATRLRGAWNGSNDEEPLGIGSAPAAAAPPKEATDAGAPSPKPEPAKKPGKKPKPAPAPPANGDGTAPPAAPAPKPAPKPVPEKSPDEVFNP